MATCFLLALGLGLALDHFFGSPAAPGQPAKQVAETSAPTVTAEEEQPSAPDETALADQEVPYRYVTLPAQDPVSGKTESVQVPVVPQEYLGDGWPEQLPSAVPERFVQVLRQHGHDVVQQRRLIPLQAADGSQVVFPVDEVEILPVGNRGYQ